MNDAGMLQLHRSSVSVQACTRPRQIVGEGFRFWSAISSERASAPICRLLKLHFDGSQPSHVHDLPAIAVGWSVTASNVNGVKALSQQAM
jgi:hypothetical protein